MERRAFRRATRDECRLVATVRLRPGREVELIDVSSGGALVEARSRLLPGTRVELQVLVLGTCRLVRGRVARCHVFAVSSTAGVTYRAGLVFDEPLELGSATPGG